MNPYDEYAYCKTSSPIDEYVFRETSSPIDEYVFRETSSPIDEYAFRETSLPTKESMFLPLPVESPEDSTGRADRSRKGPTMSPVLLSPGSTTQKLIASGKIKNCIILLQKASLGCLNHLRDEETESTTLPLKTEVCQDPSVDSLEESGAEVTSYPNCEQDDVFYSEALDVARDRCISNRNVFTSLLGKWSDVKMEGSTTVEDDSSTENSTSTVIDDYTEETKRTPNSSREISQSVSSSNEFDQIADCRSINGDNEVDRVTDSRSISGNITRNQIADYRPEIGASAICQILECRSISTDNIVDQTAESVNSDNEINYTIDKRSQISTATIDQNSNDDNIATNDLPEYRTEFSATTDNDITNCLSIDTAQDRMGISVGTVDQTVTECRSLTNTDVTDEISVSDIYQLCSSWSDDLMSISSTGSGETLTYPLSPEENFQEIIDEDLCCAEHEITLDAETADRLCDEPPHLERLESLPNPGSCLDLPPILSPPMLTHVNDDIHPNKGNRSTGLSFRSTQHRKGFSKAPPSGHATQESQLGVKTAKPPTITYVDIAEMTRTKPHLNQNQRAPIAPDENISEPRTDLADYISSERLHIELRGITSDTYLSFPSPSTETAADDQGTLQRTFPNLMDSTPPQKNQSKEEMSLSQEDQSCEVEYQEMRFQVVNKSDAPVDTNCDTPVDRSDKHVDTKDNTPIDISDDTPVDTSDTHVDTRGSDLQACSMASCVDQASPVHESKSLATSIRSSLSDINSETERAIASISENQPLNIHSKQDYHENIFNGCLEVAEVVIDPLNDNGSPASENNGIMFRLNMEERDSESKKTYGILRNTPENDQSNSCQNFSTEMQTSQCIQSSEASQSDPVESASEKVTEGSPTFSINGTERIFEEGICHAFPDSGETSTDKRGMESPPLNSEGRAKMPSGRTRAENMRDSSKTMHRLEGLVQDTAPEIHEARFSTSDANQHAQQELPPKTNILSNKQTIRSCHPDRSQEMSVDGEDSSVKINSTYKVNPTSQAEIPGSSDRNLSHSSDEGNSTGSLTNNVSFRPSTSLEMDTAISLASMSEMAATARAEEQRSNQANDRDKVPSSSAPPVRQSNSKPADSRTQTSASQVSDNIYHEETRDDATPQTPNSTHGPVSHGVGCSSEITLRNQNATSRSPRRRNGSGFTIVDCSGPIPLAPDNGQFDELKRRLMQNRRVNPTPGPPANAVQPAIFQNLPNSAVTHMSKNRPYDAWNGVPVEFPDGKRFIAYNREAFHTLPVSQLPNAANVLVETPDQFSGVSSNGPSQISGAVEIISSHVSPPQNIQLVRPNTVPKPNSYVSSNAPSQISGAVETISSHVSPPQNIQLVRPNTVPNPNSYQRQMGSNNMHSNPSFPVVQQVVENFRSPRSTPTAQTRHRNDYQQQLPSAGVHKSLGFFSSQAQKMSKDHMKYQPDQTLPDSRTGNGVGGSIGSFQEPWEGRTGSPTSRIIRKHVPIPVQDVAEVAVAKAPERLAAEYKSPENEQPMVPARMTSYTQLRNLPGTTTRLRRDNQESVITNQQVRGVSMQAIDYTREYFKAQQRFFGRARGSVAKHQSGGNYGLKVNSVNYCTLSEQNEGKFQENVSIEHSRLQATGTLTNTSQSVGQRVSAFSVHHLPRDENTSSHNTGVSAAVPESVDMSGPRYLPGRPMLASSYVRDLAETNRSNAINQNTHDNINLPLQLQKDQVSAGRREQVTRRSGSNDTNLASHEHLSEEINSGANQRPVYQNQEAQAEDDDRASLATIPDLCWKENAFPKSLPKDLTSYLTKQWKQGIPISEALASLLAEKDETTPKQQKRVWRSTIHYQPSDPSPQSDNSGSSVSVASTYPTPWPFYNQEDNATQRVHPSARDNLPQQCQNTSVDNHTSPEAEQQHRQNSKGRLPIVPTPTSNFYNPPPSVTPLLEADVAAPSKSQESGSTPAQTEILNGQENSDSALDLRTRTLGRDFVVYEKDHPFISQFSLSNANLYHRAYTAGQPGPIRASSLINLSSAAMVATPIMEKQLSPTQLLIRNKLLERRWRIQSKSISTPDILYGYSYPPKKEARVGESSSQPRNVLPPQKSFSPPCHVSDGQSREVAHMPFLASSHPDVQHVGSANRVIQWETKGEIAAQNLTTADNREPVSLSNTPAHYPKMKASLQNRWVTETVQPIQVSDSDHQQKASVVGQSAHGVQAAQDQMRTCTSASIFSASATAVDQIAGSRVGSSSDPAVVQPPTLPIEVVPMTGLPVTSQPQRKRKADQTSPAQAICPFCSFESSNSWELRSHVNRKHFEKYSRPGKKTSKTGSTRVASRVSLDNTATQKSPNISTSNARKNVNGEPISTSTQLVCRTDGSATRTSSYNNVQSYTQIVSGLTATANANFTAASSTTLLRPIPTSEHVTYIDRRTDGLRTAKATSLITRPVTNSSHIVKPNTAHQADEQLHCRFCNLSFKTSQDLLIHTKLQHTNTKGLFMCFNCGYSTKYKPTLMKHILKWHGRAKGDNKAFKCTQHKCKESFSTEDELRCHCSSHDAQRTYACDLCNAKYKHITGLRYHQSRHTVNLPHKCQQCGLKFKSPGMLQRHEFQKKHLSS